jgi:hypothetical protein
VLNGTVELQQPDFRPQPVEFQLDLRHARQLGVELQVNVVELASDAYGEPTLTRTYHACFAGDCCECAARGLLFHASDHDTAGRSPLFRRTQRSRLLK